MKYWLKVLGGMLLALAIFLGSFAAKSGGLLEFLAFFVALGVSVFSVQWAEVGKALEEETKRIGATAEEIAEAREKMKG